MNEKELRVGFVFTGSFCTYDQVFPALAACKERFGEVIPILSNFSAVTDTRFGTAAEFAEKMTEICGQKPWSSIPEVEPIGPQKLLDVLVIAPCTGNTLGKMAAGITDTSATMAAKSHLRNGRPVVLGISTNDGLAVSLRNLGDLNCRKNLYLVPFRQDNPPHQAQVLGGGHEPDPCRRGRCRTGEAITAGAVGGAHPIVTAGFIDSNRAGMV